MGAQSYIDPITGYDRRDASPEAQAAYVAACTAILAGRKPASESVTLADGAADQSLIPGVAPVPLMARQIASETARRAQRHGHAPLPCGGLWDETAQRQGSLF